MKPLINSLSNQKNPNSIILTTFNDFSNWARLSSLWPLLYGTSCCFIEFASLIGSRFDFDRYGLVPRSSPRQADLIITAGTITMKMAPSLVRLYEQMPEPKYVIAMGACTITGGMFSTDSYSTVRGVDKLIPVDIYLPGCPPKPEAIIDAIIKLRKKVAQETYKDKSRFQQGKRYLTLNHKFNLISTTSTTNSTTKNKKQVYPQFSKLQFNPTLESFALTEKKENLVFLLKNEDNKKTIQNK
uniref:NAD(P)H-quinone oxidoreductase subunit K, chloroplastic n=1 Tax=Amphidium sp. 49156 TaxID=2846781 RepID=A0A8F3BD59_9BRYO|nr:NADH-plastoquinone oxidoreductase subunit K [Amphidium sp. 49156]